MTEILIELGEPGELDERPGRAPRRDWRQPFLGLAVLTVLFGLVGSGGPPPGLIGPLWTVPAVVGQLQSQFEFAQHTVFQFGGGQVSAREPDTGRLRWQLPVDGKVEFATEVGAGMAFVLVSPLVGPTPGEVDNDGPDEGPELTLLLVSVADGRVAATTTGAPYTWSRGRLIVARPIPGCQAPLSCHIAVGVDATTGAELWQLPLPSEPMGFVVDRSGEFMATVTGDRVSIRAQATGAVAEVIELDPGRGREDGEWSQGFVAGYFVTAQRTADRVAVAARSLSGPGEWSTTVTFGPNGRNPWLYVDSCGGLLCIGVDDSVALLDPATGDRRGQAGGNLVSADFDRQADLDRPDAGAGAGETLVQFDWYGGSPLDTTALVVRTSDLAVVATIPDGSLVPWSRAEGRTLFTREVRGDTIIVVVDRHGYQRTVGTMASAGVTCQAYALTLICATRDGLSAWRLPTAQQLAFGVGDGRP